VETLNDRDALSIQNGDVVKVIDTDLGGAKHFLYSDSNWITLFKGGDAGVIDITSDLINLKSKSQISTSSAGNGNAGDIKLTSKNIIFNSGALVRSESSSTNFGGESGLINIISSNSVNLFDNSAVTTDARDAGGGKILIKADNLIHLYKTEISSTVRSGFRNGGDVKLSSATVVMNKSKITANAQDGDGGAIYIVVDHFLKSTDSNVTASSKRGKDGFVKIDAPDIDLSSSLSLLPKKFLNAEQWVKTPCTSRSGENLSQFIVKSLDASPIDYQDSLLISDDYYQLKTRNITLKGENTLNDYFDKFLYFFDERTN